MTLYLKARTSRAIPSQTQGHGFLDNGFSIRSEGWDLICNSFFLFILEVILIPN
jgi:hypothetical protein